MIRLWDGPAPGALGPDDMDVPTLTVYLPRSAPAIPTAIVVCPGGSYMNLATDYEGKQAQEYLNSLGIAVFVLKYRLGPRYHHPVELGDALRAIRLVRSRAAEWHIAPDRVGILGFSAGGHLAATASTHFDRGNASAADPLERLSSRPDFAVLVYPVISMTEPWTHQGSKTMLLGDHPDPAVARSLSNDLMVTAETPPTFLMHTNADTEVPAENSVSYYLALRKAGVPAELHIFQNGRHGIALAQNDAVLGEWPRLLANWLGTNGLLR
ncbi:MAG TPA: alpha/beta hydrolase [Gemmatimonadaceae bacterium]|nr:alpha/beta hydrolase [Gemmatimonadaceae bacterium]